MRKITVIVILTVIAMTNFAQDLRTLIPVVGKEINYSATEQEDWEAAIDVLNQDNYEAYQNSSAKLRDLVDKIEMGDGPLTQGVGCSWYCGGGPYKILASSELDTIKYKVDNIHDFSLFTGWVEGKSDYGIGEFIEFYFEPNSPRVNKLIFYNGYFKNHVLWESNSRIKKAKLYINNTPYAYLNFRDVSASQTFSIEPISSTDENQDLILKIEILEVYKGTKYSDVVVSEINFDGLDVHCLAKGTKVQLADGSLKNIEDLRTGELVAYFDQESNQVKSAKIEQLEKVIHHGLVKYKFESGLEITATQDHPFLVLQKGWASLTPDKSAQYVGFDNIKKVKVGDLFLTANETEKLILVDFSKGEQETYTISKLSSGDNFIANGLIVGVEELKKDER
ncbi:NADase-type glycan-binding domain-containing protein [Mangrovibacterium diazotrophicum]|uniref:Intein n=1 Tax=Mangrovibacterium diazotrophicum TaxID=1261403 RepID=A0A419W872_9BACT|nr:hypothetical protein [Mangrovibacterium diazotrophicum]RKD91658.1 intein [Mangrovibacterium diazotrophicum]